MIKNIGFKSDTPQLYKEIQAQNLKTGQKVAWPIADLESITDRMINRRVLVGSIQEITPNTYYEPKTGDRLDGGKNVTIANPEGGVTIFTGIPPYTTFKITD